MFSPKNSFLVLVPSGCIPSSGISGSYGDFIPSFLKNLHLPACHGGWSWGGLPRPSLLTSPRMSGPTMKRMEVASGPAAPETGEIWALKQCLLSHSNSWEKHGTAASCLRELRNKACDILAIDTSLAPVTLVLAKDGTTVDDDDYFLCLPANTKFVALAGNEKWIHNSDGGTAWITQESFDRDGTDRGRVEVEERGPAAEGRPIQHHPAVRGGVPDAH